MEIETILVCLLTRDQRCQDDSVHEGASSLCTSLGKDDGERRSESRLLLEIRESVRHIEADDDNREDVEEEDPDPSAPDSPGNVSRGIPGLSSTVGPGYRSAGGYEHEK